MSDARTYIVPENWIKKVESHPSGNRNIVPSEEVGTSKYISSSRSTKKRVKGQITEVM
jgi:hypothetical protein